MIVLSNLGVEAGCPKMFDQIEGLFDIHASQYHHKSSAFGLSPSSPEVSSFGYSPSVSSFPPDYSAFFSSYSFLGSSLGFLGALGLGIILIR